MAVMRTPQEHIETLNSSIDDTLDPLNHDANAINLADTIDYLASQLIHITGETAWEDRPDKTISELAAQQTFEDTLAIIHEALIVDIVVPGSQNYKILSVTTELPSAKVKSINTDTIGLVTAEHTGTFGTHALDLRAGDNALNPLNLVKVIDGSTGDPILSGAQVVFALLQHENGATDNTDFSDTTPERAQISFVRSNSTYSGFEACPVSDIEGKTVNLAFPRQKKLSSFTKQDWDPNSVFADFPDSATVGVNLNNAIDNQGVTPATQTTNVFWRLNDDTSLAFQESTGGRDLIKIGAAAAGDSIDINVDSFDVNVGSSGNIDFDNGIKVDSGDQLINVGITAGQIDSATVKVLATSGDLELEAHNGNMILDNASHILQVDAKNLDADFTDTSHLIQSTIDASDTTLLLASRNSGAGKGILKLESDDDVIFETAQETSGIALDDAATGPISGLFGQSFNSIAAAIAYSSSHGGIDLAFKRTILTSNVSSGTNMAGVTLDLSASGYILDMADAGFAVRPVFVFANGRLLDGADQSGDGDIYPGTNPANGDLKHDFFRRWRSGMRLFSIGFKDA